MPIQALVLLPLAILLISSLVILILYGLRPGFGFAWFLSVAASFLAWFVVLFLRFRLPMEVTLIQWNPLELFPQSISLLIDYTSWPLAIAISTLGVATILTDSARYQYLGRIAPWIGNLALTGIGYMAVLSANPLTLLLTWTAIDLVELLTVLGTAGQAYSRNAVNSFATRSIGSLIVLGASLFGMTDSPEVSGSAFTTPYGLYYLVGFGLRLGVLPLHIPYDQEPPIRRGLGTILRLIPAAAGLVLIARMPSGAIPSSAQVPLLVLLAFAAVYGGLMWIGSQDELDGRPYWLIVTASLAGACVVRGFTDGVIAWGVPLLLSGGLLFLYSARQKGHHIILMFGLVAIMGIPFTSAASGWDGLVLGTAPGLSPFFIAGLFCLWIGYWRHSFASRSTLEGLERWILLVYPLGLILIVLVEFMIGLVGWPGSRTLGMWWVSLPGSVLSAFVFVRWTQARRRRLVEVAQSTPRQQYYRDRSERVLNALTRVLRLQWIYRLMAALYALGEQLIKQLTLVLEGDGGVLWAILLMTLIISVLGGVS